MNKITNLKDIQKIELEILKYFDTFCRENELKYFLAGGTLLGAVRHSGFIPWDDDIDIAMPREDYDKLLTIKKNISSDYKLFSYNLEENYYQNFYKLVDTRTYIEEEGENIVDYGLFIDIFPIDGLGKSKLLANLRARRIVFLNRRKHDVDYGIEKNFHGIKRLIQNYYFKIGSEEIYKRIMKIATKHSLSDSRYVGSIVGGAKGIKEVFLKEIYTGYIDMKFECYIFKGMKYYDAYLTRMYGDYMVLPDKSDQISNHSFEAWKK